jgi:hypothetical protein
MVKSWQRTWKKKLEKAVDKETDLACAPGVSITNVTDICDEKMFSTRTLSAKYQNSAVAVHTAMHVVSPTKDLKKKSAAEPRKKK